MFIDNCIRLVKSAGMMNGISPDDVIGSSILTVFCRSKHGLAVILLSIGMNEGIGMIYWTIVRK